MAILWTTSFYMEASRCNPVEQFLNKIDVQSPDRGGVLRMNSHQGVNLSRIQRQGNARGSFSIPLL